MKQLTTTTQLLLFTVILWRSSRSLGVTLSSSRFKMFSLADASGRRTALVALRNCLYLLPSGYFAYDWGLTSGWFGLESTLLAIAFAGTTLSFYLNPGTKNARRMFHTSLLHLPVFMSGMLFHRLPNKQRLLDEENHNTMKQLSLSEIPQEDIDAVNPQRRKKYSEFPARPPVAYASVAPFPFMPVPDDSMY